MEKSFPIFSESTIHATQTYDDGRSLEERIQDTYEELKEVPHSSCKPAHYTLLKAHMLLKTIHTVLGEKAAAEFYQGIKEVADTCKLLQNCLAEETDFQKKLSDIIKKISGVDETLNFIQKWTQELMHYERKYTELQQTAEAQFRLAQTKLEAVHMKYLQDHPEILNSDGSLNHEGLSDNTVLSLELVPIYVCRLFDYDTFLFEKMDRLLKLITLMTAFTAKGSCKLYCYPVVQTIGLKNLTFSERIMNNSADNKEECKSESVQSSLQKIIEGWKTQPPRDWAEMQQRIEEIEKLHTAQEKTVRSFLDATAYIIEKLAIILPSINRVGGQIMEFSQVSKKISAAYKESKSYLQGIKNREILISNAKETNNRFNEDEAFNEDRAFCFFFVQNIIKTLSEDLIHFEKKYTELQQTADAKFKLFRTTLENAQMNHLRQTYPELLKSEVDFDELSDEDKDNIRLSSELIPIYLCSSLLSSDDISLLKVINPSTESLTDEQRRKVTCNNLIILISALRAENSCEVFFNSAVETIHSNQAFSEENIGASNRERSNSR